MGGLRLPPAPLGLGRLLLSPHHGRVSRPARAEARHPTRAFDIRAAKTAVELTNRCDFRCAMCAIDRRLRPPTDMPLPLVRRVAADFAAHGVRVRWLHEMGEPLLYAHLLEAIDLFPGCAISTNASRLDEAAARALLETSLGRILLCIDTVNPRHYARLRRGGRFDEVVANIRGFLDQSRGRPIEVQIQRLRSTVTAGETARDVHDFFRLDRYPQARVVEKPCEPLDTADRTDFHDRFTGCVQGRLHRYFVVLADGRVTTCCYDAHGEQAVGDLSTQTIDEIVGSPRIDETWRAFVRRDWAVLPRCGACFVHGDGGPPPVDRLVRLGARMLDRAPLPRETREAARALVRRWRQRVEGARRP